MARKKMPVRTAVAVADSEHVYPFVVDVTHAGRMARIPGRRGQYKVIKHETNPRTGAAWWCLIGPQTPGDPGQFTHVREITLVPVKRTKKEA